MRLQRRIGTRQLQWPKRQRRGIHALTNASHGYQEASMGYSSNDLNWANFQSHNFQDRHAVAYAESHDEERLMYKNLLYGNSNGDYDASDLSRPCDVSSSQWGSMS